VNTFLTWLATREEKTDVKAKEEAILNRLKKEYADWEKTVLQPLAL
jgi:hypothetical protein